LRWCVSHRPLIFRRRSQELRELTGPQLTAVAVASCACCELGRSVWPWPGGRGIGERSRGIVGLAEHLLVLARALPELPGGAPEAPVGWTPAARVSGAPSSECINPSASSCEYTPSSSSLVRMAAHHLCCCGPQSGSRKYHARPMRAVAAYSVRCQSGPSTSLVVRSRMFCGPYFRMSLLSISSVLAPPRAWHSLWRTRTSRSRGGWAWHAWALWRGASWACGFASCRVLRLRVGCHILPQYLHIPGRTEESQKRYKRWRNTGTH
jgi:hypothetical protein